MVPVSSRPFREHQEEFMHLSWLLNFRTRLGPLSPQLLAPDLDQMLFVQMAFGGSV